MGKELQKKFFFQQIVLGQMGIFTQKNEDVHLPPIIHKNKLQTDHRTTCKNITL